MSRGSKSKNKDGPPPSHPQETNKEHRKFLIRSLERNDVDLAALIELNRSLHQKKQAIIASCGEGVLLDLGVGNLTLVNEELTEKKPNGDEEVVAATTEAKRVKVQSETDVKNEDEKKESDRQASVLARLSPQQKALCTDFLLRMKLRRKLSNRLVRRLNRIAHAMDGEDVSPPIAPKYGDLKLQVDPASVESCAKSWNLRDEVKPKIEQIRQQVTQEEEKIRVEQERLRKELQTEGAAKAETEELKEDDPEEQTSSQPVTDDDGGDTGNVDVDVEEFDEHIFDTDPEPAPALPPRPSPPFSLKDRMKKVFELEEELRKMHEPLKEYDTAYKKSWNPTLKRYHYTIADVDEPPDYVHMGSGLGIGATARLRTAEEKETEYKRWQTDILGRVPDQPTFEELGMKNRVFCYQARRKRALESISKEDVDNDEEEEKEENSDKVEKTERPEREASKKLRLDGDTVDDGKVDDDADDSDPMDVDGDDDDDKDKDDKEETDKQPEGDGNEGDDPKGNENESDSIAADDEADKDTPMEESTDDKVDQEASGEKADDEGNEKLSTEGIDKAEESDQKDESTSKDVEKDKDDSEKVDKDDDEKESEKDKKDPEKSDGDNDNDDEDSKDDNDSGEGIDVNNNSGDESADMFDGESSGHDNDSTDDSSKDNEDRVKSEFDSGDESSDVSEEGERNTDQTKKAEGTDDKKDSSVPASTDQNSDPNMVDGKSQEEEKKETKAEKEKEKEAEVEEPVKRVKAMSFVPVPSFHEQDLYRIRMIHAEMMAASMTEHAQRRLAEVTKDYNNALRVSTRLCEERQRIQQKLQYFLPKSREELAKAKSEHAREVVLAKQRWVKQKREHDYKRAQKSLPTTWGRAPYGTPMIQNYKRNPGIPNVIGTCLADVIDGSIMIAEGKLSHPKFKDFVPPSPAKVNKETGETLAQHHKRIESEIRRKYAETNKKLTDSEEDRKRAWKKVMKTKSEMESSLRPGSSSRRGRNDVSYQHVPFPALRISTQQTTAPPIMNMPPKPSPPAPATPMYTPPRPTAPPRPQQPSSLSGTPSTTEVSSGPVVSQSKYSAARVRKRIGADGTVAPVSEPKKTKDGLYQRPAGRTRKGMQWDAIKGIWVPEGSQ